MKVSEAYPSDYLKAADIGDATPTVIIVSAELETVGQGAKAEQKLVLGFKGKEKRLVLNKTNSNTIAALYGDETDDWLGKPITLVTREIEYDGKVAPAIRVSAKKPNLPTASAAKPKPQAPPPDDVDMDVQSEDVPFN